MSEYIPDIRDLIDAYTYADGLERSKERRETAQKILDRHDAEVWQEGFEEPRECCGLCPNNSCPWDNGQYGPTNPYEQKEGNK